MDLLSLGKQPINSDQPTGTDVRYAPEFEELQAEIDRLSSPTASGVIDWNKVVKVAFDILSKKSKDLLVASHLAVALIHTRKIGGLAIGLEIYLDLLDSFWDNLFPPKKRLKGRLGAIEWWLEKTGTALTPLGPNSVPVEQLRQPKEYLEQIDKRLHEYFENPPDVASVRRILETISFESEKKAEPESPSELYHEPKEEKPKGKVISPELEEISSSNDAKRVLSYGLQKTRQAAAFLWQEDPTNPHVYRWTRMAVWSRIETLPPAADGNTQLPSPPAEMRHILKDLRAEEDWSTLLNSSEANLPQFVFWFDLNQYVSKSLANLGEMYQAADNVVCQETALLIQRLPGLEELHFSDGTPFAAPETKQWLKEIGFRRGEVLSESVHDQGMSPKEDEKGIMDAEIRKAHSLAKKKRLVEAIELLQQRMQNSFSEKGKLLWRLALSQLLLSTREMELAVPHLDQILQDIEYYRLEAWDPDLALKSLKITWTGFSALSDQDAQEKATESLNRIARLDPAEALRFTKGK